MEGPQAHHCPYQKGEMWTQTHREETMAETGVVSAAMSQGCWPAATRSRQKRQEASSPGASKGSTALPTP